MNKILKSMLLMALVIAMATPALAELKLSGYYRVQGTAQDLDKLSFSNSTTFIDQRLRMKLTNQLNDSVSMVYYTEVDTPWGEQSKGAIGSGGQENADGVNIETKNAYLNYKVSKFDFTVGIQGMIDNVSDVVIDNDVAGITAKAQLGVADITLRYAKLDENDRDAGDDENFYALQTGFKIKDTHRIGFDVLYFDNNSDYTAAKNAAGAVLDNSNADPKKWTWTPGNSYVAAEGGDSTQLYYSINGDFKFGKSSVTGWFLYGTEDFESDPTISTDDEDGGNWAANIKFRQDFSKGYFSVGAIYYAPADKKEDNVFTDDHGTGFQFYNEGLSIFLTDIYYNNGSQGKLYQDAAHNGYGLTALTAKGKVNLPKDFYLRCAAGYFGAADDTAYGDELANKTTVKGNFMGAELDLAVGKKFSEKVDLSLRGAYAILGDFYDDSTTDANGNLTDPENPWKLVAMLNVNY